MDATISADTLKRVAEARLHALERQLHDLQHGGERGRAAKRVRRSGAQLEQLGEALHVLDTRLHRSRRRRDLLAINQELAGHLYRLRALTSNAPQNRQTAS